MKEPQLFEKGERATKIGLITVAILGGIKGIIGLLSGSISLTAQATDSLADLISLVAVYMGLRISRKPPSERFTYGYYRVETMVSLLISIIILATGGLMLTESWNQIISPSQIGDPILVIGVAGISIPVLLWLGRYTKKVGVEINSQALQSQSEDFMTDVYSSAVVCIGVGGTFFSFLFFEGIAGAIISLLVVKTGLSLSWNSILVLMDAVEKPERLFEVKRLVESVHGVIEAKNVRMRRSGPFCFGEVTILVGEKLDIEKAHRLSHLVENQVKKELKAFESLAVHIEPIKRERQRLAFLVDEDQGLDSILSSHFGSAQFFLFIDVDTDGIKRWFTKDNRAVNVDKKRGIIICDMLLGEEATVVFSDELGEGPFHILRDNYVEVYGFDGGTTVRDVVKIFLAGELTPRMDGGKSNSS